jgi:hypothetical protein
MIRHTIARFNLARSTARARNLVCFILAAGLALAAAACGDNPNQPSGAFNPSIITNVFSGTLPVGGSSIYQLIVSQASNVEITMASLTAGPAGVPVPSTVGLALGTPPEGTEGCPRTIDRRVTPALTAHIRTERNAQTHCVEIYDVGTLAAGVNFAVRIVTIPVTNTFTPRPSAGTESFSSILAVQGWASRLVSASQSGSLTAVLTSASPPNVLVGFGIGIPRADLGGCYLTTAINTSSSASAQVASTVDAGDYCVKLYDPGTLTSNVTFTVAAAHP